MQNPDLDAAGKPGRQGSYLRLLAWRWLLAALAVLAAATLVALSQAPGPVPNDRATPAFSFWDPLETNPHRRLPRVYENLNAVYFAAGGRHGWAVGDAGRILATKNGGASWAVQNSGESRNLDLVIFEADGLRGWTGSEERVFKTSKDGGASWQPANLSWEALPATVRSAITGRRRPKFPFPGESRTLPPEVQRYWTIETSDVFQPGQRTAWRVQGLAGEIQRTDDGGKSWQPLSERAYFGLQTIHMAPDGLRGWAAGRDGVILATTDGWRTWHPQTANAQAALADVWLGPDRRHAWAVGAKGIILASDDGGLSWQRQNSGVNIDLRAIRFDSDNRHGLAAGDSSLLITTDGGLHWTPATGHGVAPIVGLQISDGGRRVSVFGSEGEVATRGADGRWSRREDLFATPHAPAFDPSGRIGWATNDPPRKQNWPRRGELLRTTDGGTTWQVMSSDASLVNVSIDSNGRDGFSVISAPKAVPAALAGQRIFDVLASTRDGGTHWEPNLSPITRGLNAVRSEPGAKQAIAVGQAGIILRTDDGGKTWRHAERYSRLPAPWYGASVVLSAGLLWLAWARRPVQAARLSVSGMAASDAAVQEFGQDRLEFGGLARGISRFLRNEETQPPLTLAITGAWGTGKSSLMQLVCADMRRFRHRPIWFNAWHHQTEEHLFAALLGAIYAQAAPPLSSLEGIGFRLRLLWLRSRRHFFSVLLFLTAVSAACAFGWHAWINGGFTNLSASVQMLENRMSPAAVALSGLLAVPAALAAAIKGATPLRINPAVLLGQAREHLSLKQAASQNDFRERFARQFGDVTRALSYKMVIIIDDLDRCRPGAVIEVMETVNYLTSAGECFVLFGMDKERVIAALGLAFKDIAAELVQMETRAHDAPGEELPVAERELAKRRTYAIDYLQKLVNIDIKVPPVLPQQHRMLLDGSASTRPALSRLLERILSLLPIAACVAAIFLGLNLSRLVLHLDEEPVDSPAVAQPAAQAPAALPAVARAAPPPVTPDEAAPSSVPQQPVDLGEQPTLGSNLQWIGSAVAVLAALGTVVAVRLFRQSLATTQDSREFQEALSIWIPPVAAFRPTPRSIKRFCNRLRYLAMLQQGEEGDKTVFELLKARASSRRKGRPGPAGPPRPHALSEQQLIALGAMYEIFGENWRQKMIALFPEGWQGTGERADSVSVEEVAERVALSAAASAHQKKFGVAWPPQPAEIAVFERLIAGVRLAGDPRPIVSRRRPESASNTGQASNSQASSAMPGGSRQTATGAKAGSSNRA